MDKKTLEALTFKPREISIILEGHELHVQAMPFGNLALDEQRFQRRGEGYASGSDMTGWEKCQHIRWIKEESLAGSPVGPLLVWRDPKSGSTIVADGHHRYWAWAEIAKDRREPLIVPVFLMPLEWGYEVAERASREVNRHASKPFTREDDAAAIWRWLHRAPKRMQYETAWVTGRDGKRQPKRRFAISHREAARIVGWKGEGGVTALRRQRDLSIYLSRAGEDPCEMTLAKARQKAHALHAKAREESDPEHRLEPWNLEQFAKERDRWASRTQRIAGKRPPKDLHAAIAGFLKGLAISYGVESLGGGMELLEALEATLDEVCDRQSRDEDEFDYDSF
jgi:hypothetical protein